MSKARRGRGEGTLIERERPRRDGSVQKFWHGRASLGYDGQGQRIRKDFYGASKSAVLEAMDKWRVEQRSAGTKYVDDGRLTVGQFLKKWLDDAVKPSRRAKTIALYAGIVKHLEGELGRLRLSALSPLHVQHALAAISRKVSGNGRTAQLAFSTLRAALNQAVKWRMLTSNPCNGVQRPKSKPREMRVWDEEQTKKFLKDAIGEPFFELYALALATGMRRGELLGLQWSDVDLERGVIRVQRQLVEVNGHMEPGDLKTASGKRRVDIPSETVAMLKRLKSRHDGTYLFSDRSKPLIGARVSRLFGEAVGSAGVPTISFHELRHTHATLLLTKGISPRVVQERLGHSNVSITLQTYSHVLPSLQADAAQALNGLFK